MPSVNVTVQVTVPACSTSVALSTPGPVRWKLWLVRLVLDLDRVRARVEVLDRVARGVVEPDREARADGRRRASGSGRLRRPRERRAASGERRRAATRSDPIDTVIRGSRRIGFTPPRSSAPNRSASASTIRAAERGRVLVGERPLGRLEDERERDRLAALADLLAAVDVEDAASRAARAGRLARGVDELAGGHLLGDGEREILRGPAGS